MTFPHVTIGLDVSDRYSQVFGVDQQGEVIDCPSACLTDDRPRRARLPEGRRVQV